MSSNNYEAYSYVKSLSSFQDVAEAIHRLPVHEQDLRLQRLKRATDCSLKKSYLPKDLQKVQTPFNFYIDVSSWMLCFLTNLDYQCSCFSILVIKKDDFEGTCEA